jgi:hypothetical protein
MDVVGKQKNVVTPSRRRASTMASATIMGFLLGTLPAL